MLDLFRERPGEVRIYLRRLPKADGGNPNSNSMALAGGLLLFYFVFGVLFQFESLSGKRLLWQLAGCLPMLAFLAAKFEAVIFCGKTRSVYHSYVFFRRRLGSFADIGQVRLRVQERGGDVKGFYVATWRKDFLKEPLQLTPKGSYSRMGHYRHTIIPKVRKLLSETPEEVSGEIQSAAVNARRKAARDGSETPPAEGAPVFSAWLYPQRLLPPLVRLGVLGYVFAIVFAIPSPFQSLTVFSLFFGLFIWAFKYGMLLLILYAMWRTLYYALQLNVTLRIHRGRRRIEFRNMLGFSRHRVPFSRLIEYTVKYDTGVKTLCLVINGFRVDPAAHIGFSREGIRAALNGVCDAMDRDVNDWFDLLYPVPQYSESYKKRILQVYDPYYEG